MKTALAIAGLIVGLHALPSHAATVGPPVNLSPPKLCVKHQTYVNAHGKTVTGCEPMALFEAEGKTLHP